ncbi:related to magnaporin protein [Phialocephala subalpina]|uniref:Related to magnaporin protein n=1 Tax=Phialocephala subalpina TaxID=576137 RepID=A0A1L7XR61_9HELO|nr:related to magnaporin protein [Phialocephala subalpina]
MQFSIIAVAFFAGLAAAVPAVDITKRQSGLCSSALDSAQCCDLSVDGIANLNCATPSPAPTSVAAFKSTCAASGQAAYCCILPLAGDALLCTAA